MKLAYKRGPRYVDVTVLHEDLDTALEVLPYTQANPKLAKTSPLLYSCMCPAAHALSRVLPNSQIQVNEICVTIDEVPYHVPDELAAFINSYDDQILGRPIGTPKYDWTKVYARLPLTVRLVREY